MALDPHAIEAAAVVIGLLITVMGGLIAYLQMSRRLSGRIETSEAGHLWEESSKLREDYRSRLVDTDIRQAKLEERVADLEAANNTLVRANMHHEHAASKHDSVVADLESRLEACERANSELRALVASLQQQLKDARNAT